MKTNILENIIHVPKKGEPIYIRSGFPHAPTFVWLGKTRAPLLQPQEAARTKNGKQGQPLQARVHLKKPETRGYNMRLFRFLLFLVPVLLYGTNCSNDTDSALTTAPESGGTTTGTGTLKLYLTDAPGEFSEVNITFTEISVKVKEDTEEDTWITVSEQEQTFDLLSLTGGLTALMGEEALDPGEYGQIRLLIKEAEVVIGEGEERFVYPLQIPSGSASGLKIGHGFTIEEGKVVELVIDFDAARSIHQLGHSNVYQLRPVLRLAIAEASGSITGTVAVPQTGLTASAVLGTETVASTAVDETTGEFTLAFLPAGSYTVTIVDSEENLLYSQTAEVTAGGTKDLGSITLDSPSG